MASFDMGDGKGGGIILLPNPVFTPTIKYNPSDFSQSNLASTTGSPTIPGDNIYATVASGTNIYFANFTNSASNIYKIDINGNLTLLATTDFGVAAMAISGNTLYLAGSNFTPGLAFGNLDLTTNTYTRFTNAAVTTISFAKGNMIVEGNNVYLSDSSTGNIKQVAISGTSATITNFTTAGSIPGARGLATDGTNFYTTTSAGNIAQINRISLSIDSTYITGLATSTPPQDLLIVDIGSGSQFFIADGSNDRIATAPISGPSGTTATTFQSSLQTTGTTNSIGFSNTGGTNTPRFYYGQSSATSAYLDKIYLTNGGSSVGGDPHIQPLFGKLFDLPHVEGWFNLFQSENIQIIGESYFPNKKVNETFLKYVLLKNRDDILRIDMRNLETETFEKDLIEFNVSDQYVNKKGLWNNCDRKYESRPCLEQMIHTEDEKISLDLKFQLDPKSSHQHNISLSVHPKFEQTLTSQNYNGALYNGSIEHTHPTKLFL